LKNMKIAVKVTCVTKIQSLLAYRLQVTQAFIHEWNEPYLPLISQSKMVLSCRPQRDERLNWPSPYLTFVKKLSGFVFVFVLFVLEPPLPRTVSKMFHNR